MIRDWEQAIEAFEERNLEGQTDPLNLDLPGSGCLKLDRLLPFLVLVRQLSPEADPIFATLVHTGATYLVWDDQAAREEFGDEAERNLEGLLRVLVRRQQTRYGAFLLLDLSTSDDPESVQVRFRRREDLPETRESLDRRLPSLGFDEKLRVEYCDRQDLFGWQESLSVEWSRRHRVVELSLRLPVLYRNAEGILLPGRFRAYRRKLDTALKNIAFRFVREATDERPQHFQVFGSRTPAKNVWKVDRELEVISEAFTFLLDITPINTERAYQAFQRNGYRGEPRWLYRPLTIDPPLLLRELYKIPIEQVEDPVFYRIFEQKRRQLELKISMLGYRRKPDFLYASLALYGGVEPELKLLADEILAGVPKMASGGNERYLNAEEFADRARKEIAWYHEQDERFTAQVVIREDLGRGVMCQKGNLLIGRETRVAPGRVEALLQHEVGIHLVTTYNGRCQPLRQLGLGLADYLAFQEGMALVAEVVSGGLNRRRLRLLAGRVLAVHCLLAGLKFEETFDKLREEYGFPLRTLFELVSRVYRGGGFTKDAIYLRGLVKTLEVLPQQTDLGGVFLGKIGFDHIPLIRELQWRLVLEPAPFLPRFLNFPRTRSIMEKLRSGVSVLDLLEISNSA